MLSKVITTSTFPFFFLKTQSIRKTMDTKLGLNPNPTIPCDFEKNGMISQLRFICKMRTIPLNWGYQGV